MKILIQQKTIALYFLILVPLLGDIGFGMMNTLSIAPPISPGILIRGSILAGTFLLLILGSIQSNHIFTLLASISAAFTLTISSITIEPRPDLVFDLTQATRLTYPLALTTLLIWTHRHFNYSIKEVTNTVITSGFVLATTLLLTSAAFNTHSYVGGTVYGNKGVFHSTNEISLAILIAFTFSIHSLQEKKSISGLLVSTVIFSALISIGSRSSIIGAIICPILLTTMNSKLRPIRIPTHWTMRHLLSTGTITAFALFIYLKLDSVINEMLSSGYHKQKLLQLANMEIDRFMILKEASSVITSRGLEQNIFGTGSYHFFREVGERYKGHESAIKAVEMDFVDIYGSYGATMFVIIAAYYLLFFYKALSITLLSASKLRNTIILVLTLTYLHSILAGHVITSPLVAHFIAPCFLCTVIAHNFSRKEPS